MKRFFAFAGLMTAAAISLTNCQPKEIAVDAAASGSVFSLTASAPGTKTTNSDLSTLWAQDDELAVFYSEGNGYTSLGAVPIVDGVGTGSGKFELSSQTALPSQADWYILYPYYELHDSSTGDIYNQLNTPAAHTGDRNHSAFLPQRGQAVSLAQADPVRQPEADHLVPGVAQGALAQVCQDHMLTAAALQERGR